MSFERSWFDYIDEREKLPTEPFFSPKENIVALNPCTENSMSEDAVKINCIAVVKQISKYN